MWLSQINTTVDSSSAIKCKRTCLSLATKLETEASIMPSPPHLPFYLLMRRQMQWWELQQLSWVRRWCRGWKFSMRWGGSWRLPWHQHTLAQNSLLSTIEQGRKHVFPDEATVSSLLARAKLHLNYAKNVQTTIVKVVTRWVVILSSGPFFKVFLT